jgi:outer membrane protein TolC
MHWLIALWIATAGFLSAQTPAQRRAATPSVPTGTTREAPPIAPQQVQLSGRISGSTPTGTATTTPLDLTLPDALDRGLRYNLAINEVSEDVRLARAERIRALSALLPNIAIRPTVSSQQVNLAAFGFSGFPGVNQIVGPFTVVDLRGGLTQSLLNFRNIRNLRAARENINVAELSGKDLREQVTLAVTGIYLQAIADQSRVEAQTAQVATAETAFQQARDRRNAGTVPGIDVLRAQVQLESEQQRLIFYEGEAEKRKLDLARAIGLPAGQVFRLADPVPYTPLPADVTLESTLSLALRQRSDYQALQAAVRAAELSRSAADAGRLPSVDVTADYGVIGPSFTNAHGTYTVAAGVNIPVFTGGRVRAEVLAAESEVRRRRAELEDLRGRIDADVRRAFTDVRSASRQVDVARRAVDLSRQELTQATDRFAAGVTNNLEVVQAQQSVALANENYIGALFAFNIAKAELVRARGDAERSIKEYLRRIE